MADITLRLIWYRLGETYKTMGERCTRFYDWYEDFSWRRVDILDMLFLGWLLAAFLVVGAINVYLRFFGLPKSRRGLLQNGVTGIAPLTGGESCQWINSALNWLYLHYHSTPELVDSWLRALNDYAKKNVRGDVQLKFERVQPGSLPPKIHQVSTDTPTQDTFTLRANVECTDLTLMVSAMQNTATNLKVTSCEVLLSRLQGQARCQLKLSPMYNGENVEVNVAFTTTPDIRLQVKTRTYDNSLDVKMVEGVVRSAIASSTTCLHLAASPGMSGRLTPTMATNAMGASLMGASGMTTNAMGAMGAGGYGTSDFMSPHAQSYRTQVKPPVIRVTSAEAQANQQRNKSSLRTSPKVRIQDPKVIVHQNKVKPTSSRVLAAPPKVTIKTHGPSRALAMLSSRRSDMMNTRLSKSLSQPGHSSLDKRLLVKVMKANGLGDKDFGCTDPYCVVQVDYPHQTHTTSVVKNTVNPFWDEHFLFDFDQSTKQLKFEVFDRAKPQREDFLGGAAIPMDEVRRMPSSRQIIPLTGRPRNTTTTSGSITVEFLFMDPTEAQSLAAGQGMSESISPRRRIETNRMMTPGGTMVTTTTTTTEKQRDGQRIDPYFSDSPARIEKSETGYQGDYGQYGGRQQPHLGAHDAALAASQGPVGARQMATSPKLTITKADRSMTLPEPVAQQSRPLTAMSGASPTERTSSSHMEDRDNYSLSTTTSDTRDMKKSKSFADKLKKKFSRPKKSRSQSADRVHSSSFRESALLKPPEHVDTGTQAKTAEDIDMVMMPDGTLRKSRSNSFSSSLKRLFKKKPKDGGTGRDESMSRSVGGSREGSMPRDQQTPVMYRDVSQRQSTPSPYDYSDYPAGGEQGYNYSTSMPATSPLNPNPSHSPSYRH